MRAPEIPGGFLAANRETCPAYWFFGSLFLVLADLHQTEGSYSVMEQWMRAGVGPPPHVHAVDEWFYVLDGGMDMDIEGEPVHAATGDSIWIPRHTSHAFKTASGGARVLNGYTPGGPEQIIAGVAVPAERRELPPEDLPLPSQEVLLRMNNNFWASSTDNAWARVAPRR